MGWVRFPLGGGAVNSRGPSAMRPGEFAAASGVKYRPNSDQLHNDLTYGDFNFRPDDFGTYYGYKGPFYLSFENSSRDWIMLVCNSNIFSDTGLDVRGKILFAPADGSAGWTLSSHSLVDNKGNQNGLTQASLTHWGDRYYLATDQGCAEIAPPTGTGPPTVTRLGYIAPEEVVPQMGPGTVGGVDLGSISWGTMSTSDLVVNDVVLLLITEYNATTGIESSPVVLGTEAAGFVTLALGHICAGQDVPTVTFPASFHNSEATSFRAYFVYYGNVPGDITYDETFSAGGKGAPQISGAPIGTSLLTKGGTSEFDAGDVVTFDKIRKDSIYNGIPNLPVDNARLIFRAFRHPSTSTSCVVWNDSLVLGDAGFDLGDDEFRQSDAIPSILRYSPPGEPWNQPVPYFLNFASEREDAIKRLLVVNDRLLVLCDQAVHTVRYLPFNNLLASQQGRVKDTVTTNVGLASPKAAVKVETPRGEMAVWLSRRGLEWSDGTGWDDACPDFTIPSDVTSTEISEAVMVTLPSEYRVDLYLGTKLYSFYYHPSHIKNGAMKMLGPTDIGKRIFGACEYRGTVYRFDGVDVEWTEAGLDGGTGYVYTGFVYGDNPFKDVVIEDLGLTHSAVDGTITMRCDGAVEGRALQTGNSVALSNAALEETGSSGIAQRGNYVRFRLDVTGDDDWAVGPMWIQGDEESGGRG